jgi:DNA repair photolyase
MSSDRWAAALAEVPVEDLLIVGAFSDAYPSVEAAEGLTRQLLAHMVEQDRWFTIVTKSDLVLRDLDLIRAGGERTVVTISLCTTDEAALRAMEPGAPTGARRVEVIHRLHDAGVRVQLNALPWIPGVTDTAGLLERLPPGVRATFSPLATGASETRRVLGRTYSRPEVWEAYLAEYQAFGHLPWTSWIRPSPPPNENHPLQRLPLLDMPHTARR